jgi:uncharacterized repeat protein (TIGR03803 family)
MMRHEMPARGAQFHCAAMPYAQSSTCDGALYRGASRWRMDMRMRYFMPLGFVLAAAIAPLNAALADRVNVLHTFSGPDGASPRAALILDEAGNLYGTTSNGGSANLGTVFKVAPDGTQSVLYSFTTKDGSQGPLAGLLRDNAGNLYGTTATGLRRRGGSVFRVSPAGIETSLYQFSGADPAGYLPVAPLIADAQGNIYGTTSKGGVNGGGTAFKLTPSGNIKVLFSFGHASDGFSPAGGLTVDKQGNLYGTTALGGTGFGGTIFKIAPDGTETTLYSFAQGSESFEPWGGVIRDKQGNLYGTTMYGSYGPNGGSVYKLAPDGTFTTLYSFGSGFRDGAQPLGNLVADRKGNLYGTTSSGGIQSCGTVFRISPDGTEKTLFSFNTATRAYHKGVQPFAGLTIDHDGNLFGTTSFAGGTRKHSGQGTVFEINARSK